MLGTLVLGRLEVGELNKYLQQKRLSNTYNSISLWAQTKKSYTRSLYFAFLIHLLLKKIRSLYFG